MEHDRASPARFGPRQHARTLAVMFFAGSVLALGVLAFLPLPPGIDIPGTLWSIALAVGVGLALFFGANRLPSWSIPFALAVGTAVVTLNIYFSGDLHSDNQMFYLWVAFYAFYFLPVRVAAAQLLLVAIGYGTVLAVRGEPEAVTRWVITMGTLTLAGTLTASLVRQLERWVERSRQRELALAQAEERFRSAFDDAAVGMALTDLDGHWLRVNAALSRLTGYPSSELVGMSFRDLTPSEDLPTDFKALNDLVSGRRSAHHAEKRYRRADGATVWISLSVSVVRDAEGRPLHFISQMQDITDRKAAERELANRALHDPLTSLPNRLLFLDRVGMALARIQRTPTPVAVFFIDLDRFKLINDSLGHAVGDDMLIEVAERLQRALRPNDTVSRFGGDEFTILCENIDERAAKAVAERISWSLSEPFVIDDRELYATASIGVSICRDYRASAEAMLRDADAAMYRAKEDGRSKFAIFDGAMRLRATERLEVENDLRRAIDRDELMLLYQPQVELATGRIFGVEALLRWQHPRRGLLMPDQFIAVAEESGLISPIGDWTIREACRQARAWEQAGHELSMSINLSPQQVADPRLADTVARIIERSEAPNHQICLEITESAAVESGIAPLAALKALGVGMALDDFGTGFSSLNQIRRLPPVDILKIDRSFIVELGNQPADNAIVAAVISMASSLGLTVIAEGIEHEDQLRQLQALGCERAQGFYFSRPVPAAAIEEMLEAGAVTQSPA